MWGAVLTVFGIVAKATGVGLVPVPPGISSQFLAVRYSLTPGLIRAQHPAIIRSRSLVSNTENRVKEIET